MFEWVFFFQVRDNDPTCLCKSGLVPVILHIVWWKFGKYISPWWLYELRVNLLVPLCIFDLIWAVMTFEFILLIKGKKALHFLEKRVQPGLEGKKYT